MRNGNRIFIAICLAAGFALAGCGGKNLTSQAGTNGAAPDKVLYDRAENDISHGRYEIGRLSLETLINSYPDSEYNAKAKLTIADSYYKEGTPSGMTQAVAQYTDFITFFPFLDEAAYAQLQICDAHFHRMEKPDQDRNAALEAEAACQTYLQKYPKDVHYKEGKERLLQIQEVLAEGDFRIASFYYLRGVAGYRAASSRLAELVNRYPLYSAAPEANWMLASIYQKTEHNDLAAQIYSRIVKDYPLSPVAVDAKAQLTKLGDPIPQADPTAMARMQQEAQTPHPRQSLLARSTFMFRSAPTANLNAAARNGEPTLTPEDQQANDVLTPGNLRIGVRTDGSTGISSSIAAAPAPDPAANAAPTPNTSTAAPNAAADPPAASSDPATQANGSNSTNSSSSTSNSTDSKNQKESSSKKKKRIPLL